MCAVEMMKHFLCPETCDLKSFLFILDVLFIGKSAGVLIIVFFMKNSALV